MPVSSQATAQVREPLLFSSQTAQGPLPVSSRASAQVQGPRSWDDLLDSLTDGKLK